MRLIVTTVEPADLTADNGATNDFLKEEFKWLKTKVGKKQGLPKNIGKKKADMVANVDFFCLHGALANACGSVGFEPNGSNPKSPG